MIFQRTKHARNRTVNPKHFLYEKLRVFREAWEMQGGSRKTLRRARKEQRTLYPEYA